ncbi:MAG: TIGR01777 family oxidoreductase [Bdellovibrionota bacterium]
MARKVVVSGSTGLVGSALVEALGKRGDHAIRLVRPQTKNGDSTAAWDPAAGTIDAKALEGCDAVVHLAGDNLGKGRWTKEKKARVLSSRVQGTILLSKTLASLQKPPAVFVCASAIGYYGSRGEEILREDSAAGTGFLADVCVAWEAAAKPVIDKQIRTVLLRIGVVLSPKGGALPAMLPAFRMGAGGKLGPGNQYFAWVALDDLVRAILFAIDTPSLAGPVNATAPHPVTNAEFTKALGKALGRPTFFPLPAFAARLAFGGEKAEEMLLGSNRVEPARLLSAGFRFDYPEIEPALHHLLTRP